MFGLLKNTLEQVAESRLLPTKRRRSRRVKKLAPSYLSAGVNVEPVTSAATSKVEEMPPPQPLLIDISSSADEGGAEIVAAKTFQFKPGAVVKTLYGVGVVKDTRYCMQPSCPS